MRKNQKKFNVPLRTPALGSPVLTSRHGAILKTRRNGATFFNRTRVPNFRLRRVHAAAHPAVVHVQRQRGRKRVAAAPPPVVAHPAVVPVVRRFGVVHVSRRQQPAAHTDAVDQLPAEGIDRRADAHRGGEAHPVGRGLPDTNQAASDQGRGEVAEKNQAEN